MDAFKDMLWIPLNLPMLTKKIGNKLTVAKKILFLKIRSIVHLNSVFECGEKANPNSKIRLTVTL